jgi:NAD(P)H-flavin reductase
MSWASANPLVPCLGTVRDVVVETQSGAIRTFVVAMPPDADGRKRSFVPGQCAMLSVIGVGESMIAMASAPGGGAGERLEFTVKAAGSNTNAMHQLVPGDVVGVRGPYGNGFPVEALRGRDLLFVGGGIGMSGLRSLLNYCIDRRAEYGRLTVVHGARTPGELCYKRELHEAWPGVPGVAVYPTVDGLDGDAAGWSGHIGLVPGYLEELGRATLGGPGAAAIVCGPPAMIRHATGSLMRLGFAPEDIMLSLELKMQCGIGRCGRCNIGAKYVCRDGPVFTLAELGRLPQEF